MNNFNCIGRITKDIDVKVTQGGTTVLNNTVAINRPFKNKQTGEREADFINFVAFGKTAEIIAQYHGKGDLIGLTGRMQSRSYENNQGQKVFVTELVVNEMHFAGGNNSANDQNQSQGGYNSQAGPNTPRQQNNSYTSAYGGQGGYNNQAQPQNSQVEPNPFQNSDGPVDISDDDLPF